MFLAIINNFLQNIAINFGHWDVDIVPSILFNGGGNCFGHFGHFLIDIKSLLISTDKSYRNHEIGRAHV